MSSAINNNYLNVGNNAKPGAHGILSGSITDDNVRDSNLAQLERNARSDKDTRKVARDDLEQVSTVYLRSV